MVARPCPLLPQPPVCSRLGLDAGTGARSGKPAGEVSCCCARNMRAELVLNGSTRHRTGHGYGCPFSQRIFRPPLCLWRIPLSPGKPRPSHGLCMGGRYVPDPPLSPTSTTTPSNPLRLSVSILQSPLPPIPVSPPGRHRPVRDTSLELGQDGDPNGLGRTATIDWPWYLPWPIADASYI